MIELPEALNIAGQLNKAISGKQIAAVTAAHTPHKLAWYYGDKAKHAGMHPKKKTGTLSAKDPKVLFDSVKKTLAAMAAKGGRDTESDLFGRPGGYKTILSKNTVNTPCPACGTVIQKEAYMGGSIYYCGKCQRL
jgi:formamidopyrimidine-DNA glycosylase